MEPPWDQVYARDVPPDFDEMRKREERKERIKPFWDLLVVDKEPKVNKDVLTRLMFDLKEEGNVLFKEGHYDIAWMHYRNAIFAVRILENRYYFHVEKEFVSSLFSNRAFCCLKKSMYPAAVQDCESAIKVHPKNIKAYYRQAQAYKHLKKYTEAYKAATKGDEIQPSSSLKELIEELEPLANGSHTAPSAHVQSHTEIPERSGEPDDNSPTPDDDWLRGTNIGVTKKHLENKTKMPPKKNKKSKNKPAVRMPATPDNESDDDDGTDESNNSLGVEDDQQFANLLQGVKQNNLGSSLLNGKSSSMVGGLDILTPPKEEEDSAWSFPHDADEFVDWKTNKTKHNDELMGLDRFQTADVRLSDHGDSESASYTASNASSGRSSRASQSPAKFMTVQPRQTSSHTATNNDVPTPHIVFPLNDDFDFKMACRHCFAKIGEGIKGFRYVNASHMCQKDLLILKKKGVPGLNWVKIRPRPESVSSHYGPYKICTQFAQGKPCKVGEEKCTFPHHQPELKLWTLDRDGQFSVDDFIKKCIKYKIDDNNKLEALNAKPRYIPGLNFAGGKAVVQTLQKVEPTLSPKDKSPPSSPGGYAPSPQHYMDTQPASIQAQQRHMQQMMQYTNTQVSPYSMNQKMIGYPPQRYQYQMDPFMNPNFSRPPPAFGYPIPQAMAHQQWIREVPTVLRRMDPPTSEDVVELDNPLAATHIFKIVCTQCFKPSNVPGYYNYLPCAHKCEETVLAMQVNDKSSPWMRIRERRNHRDFKGEYMMCRSITLMHQKFCKHGEENCSFAHNDVEKYLWTLEKDGKFNIMEFIMQNRKQSNARGFTLKEIMDKHGGHFEFICRSCYYGTPPLINPQGEGNSCSGNQPHNWNDYKIMSHFGPSGDITLINPRGFLHKTAFFKICKWLKFCRNRVNAECRFAHSMVERDVWMLERDLGIGREEIARQAALLQRGIGSGGKQSGMLAIAAGDHKHGQDGDESCPFTVIEVCETCWKKGQKILQQPGKDRCQKDHTNWTHNIVYLIIPSNKELRPLPKKIPTGYNFIICKFLREGKRCGYTGAGPCQFAHSTEELEAWKYMCLNNLTREQLVEWTKEIQKARAESTKNKISGQSVVSVSKGPVLKPALPVGNIHTFYCHYCGISCNSQKQWDEHCASEKHNFNVNSDREHQWNYRQPPWTAGRSYELCMRHKDGNKCQYSNVPEMYNLCRFAHSSEELDEWRERYDWRQMKREMARQEKVFSYMDQLLEKYESSQSSLKVICEELEGVQVKVLGTENVYQEEKNSTYIWTFEITTKKCLEKVSLLYNKDRLHFAIQIATERAIQIAPGECFLCNTDQNGKPFYRVPIKFTGGMFGSFFQWVIFDFGGEPVLAKKLTVEVGNKTSHEKVKRLREQLKFDRWTGQNREIVRNERNSEIDESLLSKYKEPSSSDQIVTQTTVSTELNRYNYVQKMHTLLELEEMTRHQIISSYNLCSTIECQNAIEEYVHVYAKEGELFAKVWLVEHLSEDTDAGKLILTSVRTVLLAPLKATDGVVYEASIVREENFNYDGRGKEFIYLCLSPLCVKRLNLRPGEKMNVEIQFQMNRLSFCRMHYAVDQLKSTDLVFPDVPKINPLRNEKHNLRIGSSVLNPDQLAAVRHIVAERTGYTPPFVMFGPFGTGKTETIAQAAMVLLKETKYARILICAQSNSAADLYIIKHFDSFLRKNPSLGKLRRVYFKERRVYTVDPVVKKYCLIQADESFELPTREDIEKHRIVIVTITSSLLLTSIQLQGMFTHIFIDEAAQSLECEALMPMSLATEKTCVVLAGDHNQISPKVYSRDAWNQKFHVSLLERLYNYYDSHSTLIDDTSPLNIPLSINYRTKMEILRFISSSFYGGPDKLKSEANIPSVVEVTPLMFYTVQGREVQDETSISFYNMAEVREIVERVDHVFQNWPHEWGQVNARDIGVVTPYYDQVLLIRKELKRRSIALKDVMVERVQGVQGKEFRAMFISTVRTRHLIEIQSPNITSECDGDWRDFGFLSDSKLLNTALTRAQSLVVVVGDPVALCTIGECVNIWRTYLKHCQNMKSLYPKDHNYETIKQQVLNIMNSPNREKLLQLGNERQISEFLPASQSDQPKRIVDGTGEVAVQRFNGHELSEVTGPVSNTQAISHVPAITTPVSSYGSPTTDLRAKLPSTLQPPAPLSLAGFGPRGMGPPAPLKFLQQKKVESFIEVGENFVINPEDVMYQLAKCVVMEQAPEKADKIDRHLIKVGEESNHAVLYYNTSRVLPSTSAPDNVDKDTALSLLSNPEKYLHCVLKREGDMVYANNLGSRSVISQVFVPNRWFIGQANMNDEVVIEIMRIGTEVCGKVVGVIKRALDLTNRYIVCRVGDTSGIMVPLDASLGPMYNLTTEVYIDKNKAGKVTVYKFTKTSQIRFSHFESIMPDDLHTLFVTKFLSWDKNVGFPLCAVVGVIPAGSDVPGGLKILELQHKINKKTDTAVINEAELMFPEKFQLTGELLNTRDVDIRASWCFCIDRDFHETSERAFSIDEVGDGSYLVGVHVSDVSAFVAKDSGVDLDASNKGTAVNPLSGQPVSLYPPRLSSQICNFVVNEDRLAVSILMTVQRTGEVKAVDIKKSIINVKKRFTFKEAEEALHDPNAQQDYLKSCVFVLFEFSRIWRKERLGNAASYQENYHEKIAPLTQQLVQELVNMTEYHIASIVFNRFKLVTPLYVQRPPNESILNAWRLEHAADAINSIALTKPFLNPSSLETCRCCLACTHTVNYVRQLNMPKREYMEVISGTWDTLHDAINLGDFNHMQNTIVAAENHPQLAVALLKLERMQEVPKLTCSFNVMNGDKSHYGLNRSVYTHFTQPLSRYIDVVLQRMLTACLENRTCPYTQKEMDVICENYSRSCKERQNYEDQVFLLHLSSALLSRPLVLLPVVESILPDTVNLCVAALPCMSSMKLDLSNLGACQYVKNPSNGNLILKWRERVYDIAVLQTEKPLGGSVGELNPDRFIYKIPAFQWQRLLIAIREQDEESRFMKLRQAVETVRKQVINPAIEGNHLDEVTLEVFKHDKQRRFAEFSLEMHTCQVLRVQISARLTNGMLTPYVQLLNLTPRLDICLEHRQSPQVCFTSMDDDRILMDRSAIVASQDITLYQRVWSRLNELEAVTRSVASNSHTTIHNVGMIWQDGVGRKPGKIAEFSVPSNYLYKRRIKIDSENQLTQLQIPSNSVYCQAFFADYVCVRYSNVMIPDDPALDDSLGVVVNKDLPVTWVGHCKVTSVVFENKLVIFKLELLQSDVPLPLSLTTKQLCTVELIERSDLDRNILCSNLSIPACSQLSRSILLRNIDSRGVLYSDGRSVLQAAVNIHPVPNQQQEEALLHALQQRFTVVHGVAGSGKTQLAVKLAYMMHLRNKRTGSAKAQVLLCASSESAVDVLMDNLAKLQNSCPRVVRVYSNELESILHPHPRDISTPRPFKYDSVISNYSTASLHNLARSSGFPFSKSLMEFDTLFSLYSEDISDDQFDEYRDLMLTAENALLKGAEVIVCTCSTSGLPKLYNNTNIHQVIIDDANACTEPESIVPLVLHKNVDQVVMFGDMKQLDPQVLDPTARRLGLATPLMNSYIDVAIKLTVQYRVHEEIIDIPCKQAYDSRLLSGNLTQRTPSVLNWPGGRTKPSAFCNIDSLETCVPPELQLMKEDVYNNLLQSDFAVRVVVGLTTRYQVSPNNIAVISSTKGQALTVREKLKSAGQDVISLTILESQGKEFDYVILSTVRAIPIQKIEVLPDEKWKIKYLGNLCDRKQTIVALTRARKGLIIVGNRQLLCCDKLWNSLLINYDMEKKLVTADNFLQTMAM